MLVASTHIQPRSFPTTANKFKTVFFQASINGNRWTGRWLFNRQPHGKAVGNRREYPFDFQTFVFPASRYVNLICIYSICLFSPVPTVASVSIISTLFGMSTCYWSVDYVYTVCKTAIEHMYSGCAVRMSNLYYSNRGILRNWKSVTHK